MARRPGWFLAAGALFAFLLWIAGQGLVGNVFSGSDTDPNTGPLVILLAAAMVPTVIASKAAWRSPAGEVLRRSPRRPSSASPPSAPRWPSSASYPAAAPESTSSAMAAWPWTAAAATPARARARSRPRPAPACRTRSASRSPGSTWPTRPYMIMSGTNGMDMNGADASAAAGFNTTKPDWHYTGPAIPQAEAQALLADGNNGPSDIHMAESGCAPSLTAAEDIGAEQYVQATSAAVSALRHAGGGGGRRVRARVADGLPGRRTT